MSVHLPPLLAELGSIEKMVITVLAVAGGFLVGAILTHVLGRMFFSFIIKGETPEKLMRVIRFAGGVAAAILVYLLLSGEGGLGLGGKGGGDSTNTNQGDNKDQTPPKKEEEKKEQKKDPNKDKSGGSPEELVVTVLRYDSPGKKFYRLGDDPEALTIEDLLVKIDDPAKAGKPRVSRVRIERVDPEYSVQAVSLLKSELQGRNIRVVD